MGIFDTLDTIHRFREVCSMIGSLLGDTDPVQFVSFYKKSKLIVRHKTDMANLSLFSHDELVGCLAYTVLKHYNEYHDHGPRYCVTKLRQIWLTGRHIHQCRNKQFAPTDVEESIEYPPILDYYPENVDGTENEHLVDDFIGLVIVSELSFRQDDFIKMILDDKYPHNLLYKFLSGSSTIKEGIQNTLGQAGVDRYQYLKGQCKKNRRKILF